MSLTGFLSYSRVNWQQSPSKSTPLSAANLNIMDAGIKNNNDMISNLRDEVTQLNSNLIKRLVDINVQSWAENLQNGFYVYRTDNTCTGQYEDGHYTMGFVICFDGNIRIFMFDMLINSNCFTCSKGKNGNWSNYIKIS